MFDHSPRADAFMAKDSEALAEWFKSIGLDMYSDLMIEKAMTGEKLAEIAAEEDSHELVVSCWEGGLCMCNHMTAF